MRGVVKVGGGRMAGREVDAALVECGEDRNEDERGEGKTSKRKKGRKGKEMG